VRKSGPEPAAAEGTGTTWSKESLPHSNLYEVGVLCGLMRAETTAEVVPTVWVAVDLISGGRASVRNVSSGDTVSGFANGLVVMIRVR
jgi:hypothetical protein